VITGAGRPGWSAFLLLGKERAMATGIKTRIKGMKA
jgi:hypothetical protein